MKYTASLYFPVFLFKLIQFSYIHHFNGCPISRAVRPVNRTGFQPVQEKPVCEPVWQKLIIFNLACFSKKTG